MHILHCSQIASKNKQSNIECSSAACTVPTLLPSISISTKLGLTCSVALLYAPVAEPGLTRNLSSYLYACTLDATSAATQAPFASWCSNRQHCKQPMLYLELVRVPCDQYIYVQLPLQQRQGLCVSPGYHLVPMTQPHLEVPYA